MKIRKGAALAMLTVLLSCTTKNDASIEIAAVCSPPEDASQCKFSSKCDLVLMARPWVATQWGGSLNSLTLPIQVNNRLKSNENESLFRVNTNDFTLEEFRLSFSSTPPLAIPSQTYKINQLVPANGSTVTLVSLIPEEAMAVIDAENLPTIYDSVFAPNIRVDVAVKAFGHTRDGHSMETESWVVPVDVFDVDTPARNFDPICVVSGVVSAPEAVCPKGAQTASVKCGS